MEFFSTTEVINRRYSKGLKILLGIICFLDIFVIIVEFLSNGRIGTIYFVSLIFLIPAFLKIGVKRYSADVLCKISEDDHDFDLLMSDIVIDKKDVLSRSYHIAKKDLRVFIDQKIGKIEIVGNGSIRIFGQNGQSVFAQAFTGKTIELIVNAITLEELRMILSPYIIQN